MGLKQEQVTGSVLAWWRDEFPLSVLTVWPGTAVETAGARAWIEIWVEEFARGPQRSGAPERMDLSISVHCFVEGSTDKGRVQEIADAVRETLSQRTIPIHDHDASGAPLVGYVRILEAETRELTRNQQASLQEGLQHVVVTWRGVAQQVEG